TEQNVNYYSMKVLIWLSLREDLKTSSPNYKPTETRHVIIFDGAGEPMSVRCPCRKSRRNEGAVFFFMYSSQQAGDLTFTVADENGDEDDWIKV
ncbi:hypothetical protein, partial [Cetobacterium sp.]|uniref:hypothetical protein n=1 Tax=Cetobacterium sp. TaxID=2071632 RepID=UPI003EE51638